MGKYGNGVSMKSAMLQVMADVVAALDRSNITSDDREIVLDALKNAFFMYAQTNAAACAFEENVMTMSKTVYSNAGRPEYIAKTMMKKLQETYPSDWETEMKEYAGHTPEDD